MNRYWCSFFFKGDDYRSIEFPPPKGILGYWNSGTAFLHSGEATCLVIWVEAENEEKARELIASEGAWPESKDSEWRFFNESTSDPSDRFPPSDWNRHYWSEEGQEKRDETLEELEHSASNECAQKVSFPPEAHVVINGETLNTSQSITVRVALQHFAMDLCEEGLGDDETGKALCDGYLRCIGELNKMLVTKG